MRRVGCALARAATVALAFAGALAAGPPRPGTPGAVATAGPRRRAEPPARCPAAAFVVDGPAPLLPDGSGAAVVVTAQRASLGGSCGAVEAHVRATRRFTRITATWLACERLVGKVRLRARIDAATCRTMTGVLRAPRVRVHQRFTALRTRGGIAGRLVPPAGAHADADTAALGAAPDNDRTASAQPLAVPATVGGAAYWRSDQDRDDDVYAIVLDGRPMTATLQITDPVSLDLDLLLLDERLADVVPPSRGSGATETLATTEEAGPAYLVVFAFRGPFVAPAGVPWTAYTLTLARGDPPVSDPASDDVGPVLVRLLDADTGDERQRVVTDAAGGWRLDFPDPMAPGAYHVVAGTDRDGDGANDDPGEAVARTAQPVVVDDRAVVLLELPLIEWPAAPLTPRRRRRPRAACAPPDAARGGSRRACPSPPAGPR